jgi:hypothetical protein
MRHNRLNSRVVVHEDANFFETFLKVILYEDLILMAYALVEFCHMTRPFILKYPSLTALCIALVSGTLQWNVNLTVEL